MSKITRNEINEAFDITIELKHKNATIDRLSRENEQLKSHLTLALSRIEAAEALQKCCMTCCDFEKEECPCSIREAHQQSILAMDGGDNEV